MTMIRIKTIGTTTPAIQTGYEKREMRVNESVILLTLDGFSTNAKTPAVFD